MTVAELIVFLQTQPQDMIVAYDCYSEHCILESRNIGIVGAGEPRPDGWIARERHDKPTRQYLMFPGN